MTARSRRRAAPAWVGCALCCVLAFGGRVRAFGGRVRAFGGRVLAFGGRVLAFGGWALPSLALAQGDPLAHDVAVLAARASLDQEPLALPDSAGQLTVVATVEAPPWGDPDRPAPPVRVQVQLGVRGVELDGRLRLNDPVLLAALELPYAALVPDRLRPPGAPNVRVEVPLSDGALRAFAAARQGRAWAFAVEALPPRDLFEGDRPEARANNRRVDVLAERFRPISGLARVGNTLVRLSPPLPALGPSEDCPGADVLLDPAALALSWLPAAPGPWRAGELLGPLCARWVPGPDGIDFDLAPAPGARVNGLLEGVIDGAEVRLAGSLSEAGFTPALVAVGSAGLSTHGQELEGGIERPRPVGVPGVLLIPTPAVVDDFSDLRLVPDRALWLQPDALPFSLRLASLHLAEGAVVARWDRIWSHLARRYDPEDPRGDPGAVVSNTSRFARPGPGPGEARISAEGLSASLPFAGGARQLHYPRVVIEWQGGPLEIRASALAPGGAASGEGTRLELVAREGCPGCPAADAAGQAHPLTSAGPLGQSPGGALLGRVRFDPQRSRAVRWGAPLPGGGRTFERRDDPGLRAVFAAPGFVATGSGESGDVPAALRASWEAGAQAGALWPVRPHPAGSAAHAAGDHFYPGVTVGPERYRGPRGRPVVGLGTDLAGSRTWLTPPGAAAAAVMVSDAHTKYVLRPSGVTGVFNAAAPPGVDFYGYSFEFSSFAFRQVANELDALAGLAGQVRVRGRGDFTVAFSRLALECTGQLGAGQPVARDCAADPPLNCGQRLRAWRAPYAIESFSFVPEGGADACDPAPRRLLTAGSLTVHALDRPLDLSARWSPEGEAHAASVSGATRNAFDRRQGEAFEVRLDADVALAPAGGGVDEGWFAMSGRVPLPFWDAPRAALRFENGAAGAAQTLVARPDALPEGWDRAPRAAMLEALAEAPQALRARYRWGSTPFQIDLPVRLDPARLASGLAPRFVGLPRRDFDLVVLQAYAGTRQITPTHTTIEFGASADFDKVFQTDVDLHLDLNDPESVARADAFLARFLPGNGPWIGPVVDTVRQALSLTRRITGSGFNRFLEQQLRAAVDALVRPAYGRAARALRQLQALPAQLGQIGVAEVRQAVQALLAPLRQGIDQYMQQFFLTWPGLVVDAGLALDANLGLPALVSAGLQVNLDQLRATDRAFAAVEAGLTQVEARLRLLQGQLQPGLVAAQQQVRQALAALDGALAVLEPGPGGLPLWRCGPSLAIDHLFLRGVAEVRDAAAQALQAIQGNQVVQVAVALAALVGVDQATIQRAEAALQAKAGELALELDAAVDDVTETLGGGCQVILEAASAHRATLFEIRDALVALEAPGAFDDLIAGLAQSADRALALADRVRGDVRTVRAALAELIDDTERLLNDEVLPPRLQTPSVVVLRASLQLRLRFLSPFFLWYAPDVGGRALSFVQLFEDLVLETYEAFIAELVGLPHQLLARLNRQISLPSEDALVERLVRDVMNSAAVRLVDEALHRALTTTLDRLDGLGNRLFDTVNQLLQAALARLEARVEEALAAANSALRDLPISAARMDGFATFRGNQIELLHLGAEWTLRGEGPDDSSTFRGALDVTRWTASAKGANCAPGALAESYLDALISGFDLPLTVAGSALTLKEVAVGFTLRAVGGILAPIGLLGRVESVGVLDFKTFELFDLALAVGAGAQEAYLGARGGARFSQAQLEAAFLAGRTCDPAVLEVLDPQVSSFLDLQGPFAGAFVRGSLSLPLWDNGCALSLGASADAGAWVLQGPRLGGLVGGSLWGEGLCIAALRGSVTALAEDQGGQVRFRGEGFGVAGLGFDCDPHTWTTVARSRQDRWCGTGDATFRATYDRGWDIDDLDTSAIH